MKRWKQFARWWPVFCLVCVPILSAHAGVKPDQVIHTALENLFDQPLAVTGFPHMPLIQASAAKHGLPEPYLLAVARGESFFDASAVSHKGAVGIMQVLPSTAAGYGVGRAALFDPAQNIDVGARYLAEMYKKFQDPYLALGAYYCGPGGVNKSRFQLRADCNEYVHYIYGHLQKVLSRSGTAALAANPGPLVLTWFDNYLDALDFTRQLAARLPRTDLEVLRNERRGDAHFRYVYQVMINGNESKDRATLCRQVQQISGFDFCR